MRKFLGTHLGHSGMCTLCSLLNNRWVWLCIGLDGLYILCTGMWLQSNLYVGRVLPLMCIEIMKIYLGGGVVM